MTLLAEEDAKERWCPFANVYVAYQATGAGGNRRLDDSNATQPASKHAKCIASQCMAWRRGAPEPTGVNPDGSAKEYVQQGYCGLAGTP